jgi:hypothetical protein
MDAIVASQYLRVPDVRGSQDFLNMASSCDAVTKLNSDDPERFIIVDLLGVSCREAGNYDEVTQFSELASSAVNTH